MSEGRKSFLALAGRAPPFLKKEQAFFFEKKKQKTFTPC
jgi:hypothetical protein